MSRRPMDKVQPNPSMGYGQQAVWDVIRARGTFTITDIYGVVDMNRGPIIAYVKRLVNGGYVARTADFERDYTYELVRDAGREAPRLHPDGTPSTLGQATQNLWRSMRMIAQFSPLDLVANSNTDDVCVELGTAKAYCKMLKAAGYLRETQKPNRTKGKSAVYRLIRNTGPKAPVIQRVKSVYDPNLGEVTYTAKAKS